MRRRFQDHMVGGCSNGVFLEVGLRVDLSPAIQRFGECDFHLLGSKTFELKCITRKLPEKDSQRDLNLTRPSFKMDKFLYGTSQASFLFISSLFQTKNIFFYTHFMWEMSNSIWCWDSNPRPSAHGSPPITTEKVFVHCTTHLKACPLLLRKII